MLALLFVPSLPATAETASDRVTGTARGSFRNQTTAVVDVTLTINGRRFTGTSTATILAQRATTDTPSAILALTRHVFEFGGDGDGVCEGEEDCFQTADDATLWSSPGNPGLYTLHSSLTILDGTGRFKNVSGRLGGYGVANFNTGAVEWRVWGSIIE